MAVANLGRKPHCSARRIGPVSVFGEAHPYQISSNIQYQISNIQYQISNIQYPISNIKYPISNIQYPISKYPISNIKYPISNIKYPISNIQYPISNIQYPISNIQYQISNIQYQIPKWLIRRATPQSTFLGGKVIRPRLSIAICTRGIQDIYKIPGGVGPALPPGAGQEPRAQTC